MNARDIVRSIIPLPVRDAIRDSRLYARRVELYVANRPRFTCPACGYDGKFLDQRSSAGDRKNAVCPRCASLERHRLLYCVLEELFTTHRVSTQTALHFAPEKSIAAYLRPRFAKYTTADLDGHRADATADLRQLPFEDQSYDFILASHVLEHVDDDRRALSEIARVLKPGGVAILPVPVVSDSTIEYPYPVPTENYHVRAPGPDYFDRYRRVFAQVDVKTSADYPDRFQLYIYEDRSVYPTPAIPFRKAMRGDRHLSYIPVCYRSQSVD